MGFVTSTYLGGTGQVSSTNTLENGGVSFQRFGTDIYSLLFQNSYLRSDQATEQYLSKYEQGIMCVCTP